MFIQSAANPKIYIIKNGVLQSGYSASADYYGWGDSWAYIEPSSVSSASWSSSGGYFIATVYHFSRSRGSDAEEEIWWHWSQIAIDLATTWSSVYITIDSAVYKRSSIGIRNSDARNTDMRINASSWPTTITRTNCNKLWISGSYDKGEQFKISTIWCK